MRASKQKDQLELKVEIIRKDGARVIGLLETYLQTIITELGKQITAV